MTDVEKELILDCLQEYEIGGKVTISSVHKILSELVDEEKNK